MNEREEVCVCMIYVFRVYCSTCVATHHHEVREVQVLVNATNESEAEEMWINFSICLHAPCL